jgi:magnesium chelatase accessory protein
LNQAFGEGVAATKAFPDKRYWANALLPLSKANNRHPNGTRPSLMYQKPNWAQLGGDWPNRDYSQFVTVAGLNWHVQIMGEGPVLLLLHGTGAATHSWAGLMPLLAKSYKVVALDLPGHGFTDTPRGNGLSLPGMSRLIAGLVTHLKLEPIAIIGHSAGAAIGAELILTGGVKAGHLIALNGAFKPFDGLAAHVFPVVAKLIVLNPITILALSARGGDKARVRSLLEATGSKLTTQGIDYYARLFGVAGHVNGVLGMMARWELGKLVPRLHNLKAKMTLIVGTGDKTISPDVSRHVAEIVPGATLVELPRLGHLAHEEAPETVAEAIEAALKS